MNDPTGESGNYKWGIFYCNRNDQRIFVPKRYGIGFTLNFGKPFVALGCLLVILLIIFLSIRR